MSLQQESARLRAVVLALCLLGLHSGAATAAPHGPHVKSGIPYATARRQLIAQGFDPIRVLANHGGFGGEPCPRGSICRTYPELADCAADIPTCLFLFRRRSDGSYWMIDAQDPGEEFMGLRRVRYGGAKPAERSDLEELVVRLPNGRRVSFETPLPLCSTTVWMNCRAPPPPRRRARHGGR
jgi:hypothetical protein